MHLAALLLATPLAGAAPAPAPPPPAGPEGGAPPAVVYPLRSDESVLYAVSHTRAVVPALSKRHVLRAGQLDGAWSWSPGQTPACALDVTISAEALRVDDPEDRRLAGLTGALEADERDDVLEAVLGEGLLAAADHPTLSFHTTGCAVRDTTATLEGTLSLGGASDTVLVPVLIDVRDGRVRVTGALPILQSRFGIEPFRALFGAIEVDDAVRLSFDLVGAQEGGPPAAPTPAPRPAPTPR